MKFCKSFSITFTYCVLFCLFPRVALLQVATFTSAYLFDVTRLNKTLSDEDWAMFGERIFMNVEILKLGKSCPQILHTLSNLIRLGAIFKKLLSPLVISGENIMIYKAVSISTRCLHFVYISFTFNRCGNLGHRKLDQM